MPKEERFFAQFAKHATIVVAGGRGAAQRAKKAARGRALLPPHL